MTGGFGPDRQDDLREVRDLLRQQVRRLGQKGGRVRIRAGHGGLDETAMLFSGETDIAVATPVAALRLLHQFGDLPGLVSLGAVPRSGALVAAVDAGSPQDTVGDLVTRDGCLTVAAPADDGVNLVGFAVRRALRIAGIGAEVRFVHDALPADCFKRFARGEADLVIHDLVSATDWAAAAGTRPVKYLSWGRRVLHSFESQGWPTRAVSTAELPYLNADLPTLDCSDIAVLCREDLDEEVARLTARFLEARAERSTDTAETVRSPLPSHPAVALAHADLLADVPLGSR